MLHETFLSSGHSGTSENFNSSYVTTITQGTADHATVRIAIFVPIPFVVGLVSSLYRYLRKKGLSSAFSM